MKNLMILLTLLLSSVSFGQSKKAENLLLRQSMHNYKESYDSSAAIYLEKFAELEKSRVEVRTILRYIDNLKRKNLDAKNRIVGESSILTALGFDANSLVSKSELDSTVLSNPQIISQYPDYLFNEVYYYKSVHDTLKLDGLKVKTQNALLDKQINLYKGVEANNADVIKRETESVQELKTILSSLDPVKKQLEVQYKDLLAKFILVDNKLHELKENYRVNGPKGFSEAYEKQFPEMHKIKDPAVLYKDDYDVGPAVPPAPPTSPEIFDVVEEPAEFPGGKAALLDYLAKNLKYPETALELGISGKVYLKFIVSEKGNVSNVKVAKGIADCKECDTEAVRVVKSMPNWTPGKNKGKAVNSWYTLPIVFKAK